jgi:hypothetical protein
MTLPFHFEHRGRGVGDLHRSAGAGVKSVVAVDFSNGMIDVVLKQHS